MEILVALALLGLIVILVLNIFPSSVLATHTASDQIEAENIAQSALEQARGLAFSGLSEGNEILPSPNPKFEVEREFFSPAGTDSEQTLSVKITVRWDSHGKRRELRREVWISSVRS